jgi:hypothetical protein
LIAIGLASIALPLVLIAYFAGLVNRVVVVHLHDADAAAVVASASTELTLPSRGMP